ncbi:efflux RND transporter permease subunit [Chroococcus sp. FPU101]|uniref:efflux RND transporter permease subunit n=1 Tax=Chroococcus sp. FPU101 TaxID=1974212 RepID=UPI001A905390|nr:efflux RND transporter permease subunit [Chroococcus sp. FPU101]GFE70270.1 acriflavin resistance protein [Chroococcus sp. FPU101]
MTNNIRKQFNISRIAIRHPRFTIAFWLGVAIAGLLALSSLKYGLFPEISFPVVVVNAQNPIETALLTETKLTQPLETTLNNIETVRDVSSMTYPGRAVVNVLFDIGDNLETSTEIVKQKLSQISLPPNTTYDVIPVNLNESPVISYALLSETKSLDELSQIAKTTILPKLQGVSGVLKVNLLGDASITSEQSTTIKTQFPTLIRFNQQNALALQVIKTSKANTLEVVSQVEKVIQTLQPQLKEIQLTLGETQAGFIREATQATIEDLILAIILSILIVFPFLRSFRATLITALAIPLSLLGTCIVMAIFGFNLETITLLALTLVIGIVIDDAIVDVENISRHIEEGYSPKEAAILGTDEIGLSVTASTITIAAVFIPVAFMGGAIGKFFKPFGLTVSAAVLISLLVARTLSPVLAVYWLKRRNNTNQNHEQNWAIGQSYRNLLRWSLHHRKIVIGLAILSFVVGVGLIPLIPKGFMPQLDRGEFNIVYTVPLPKLSVIPKPENTPTQTSNSGAFDWISEIAKSPESILLRRTQRIGERIEEAVLKSPDVESVFTVSGIQGTPNKGKLYVTLKHERQLKTAQVQEQVRQNLPQLKGVTVSVEDIPFVQTEAEKPLQIAIRGQDLKELYQSAETLKNKIAQLPGFEDVELSSQLSDTGEIVQIERLSGTNTVYLEANLSQGQGLEDATQIVEDTAKSILPADITLKRWGSSSQSYDVLSSFGRTLSLSILLMLLVLLALFGRLLEPIVVGLSLPLSVVGAMLGLLITRSAFGIISLIGLIFLVGLLDKNAVLLLDYIKQLRRKGMNREEAILETGYVRLRPIIMTTASTILGMLPIALGLGAGAELRQPMAVAISGGLLTSSLLSLIVVPVLYTILEDVWLKIGKGKTG